MTGEAGLGTAVHTVRFGGDGIGADQNGTAALAVGLEGVSSSGDSGQPLLLAAAQIPRLARPDPAHRHTVAGPAEPHGRDQAGRLYPRGRRDRGRPRRAPRRQRDDAGRRTGAGFGRNSRHSKVPCRARHAGHRVGRGRVPAKRDGAPDSARGPAVSARPARRAAPRPLSPQLHPHWATRTRADLRCAKSSRPATAAACPSHSTGP